MTTRAAHANHSKQGFPDGSVAARPDDRSAWEVICGPDEKHHDTDAPCEAADFVATQNKANQRVLAAAEGENA